MNSANIEINSIYAIVAKYKSVVEPNLIALENEILIGRDREADSVPIYLTRRRIKKVNSVYLKLKRKPEEYKKLENIKDYAGLKVLCLFEQDIFPIHEYLLGVFKNQDYKLEECLIINWNAVEYKDLIESFEKKVKEIYKINALREYRESNYRSIHYIIKGLVEDKYYIEVQLRTLFQDVWAELEHTLVYKKGNVHPHIKKSFDLLAQNFETNDLIINHLKDISDKEGIGKKYLLENIGPHKWFDYEPEIIPEIFKENGICYEKYNEYTNFISSKKPRFGIKDWIKEAWDKFNDVRDCISPRSLTRNDKNVIYWDKAECSFLTFCNGDYNNALIKYEELEQGYPDKYIVYFRKGEIKFIQREIEEALKNFDLSERILANVKNINYENLYRIKVKLSYIYWTLGDDFIDSALEKIQEANIIYNDYKKEIIFHKEDYQNLINNIVYYQIEKFILIQKKYKIIDVAHEKYNEIKKEYETILSKLIKDFQVLEKTIKKQNKEKLSSNICDTVAWYYYNLYKIDYDENYLDEARKYAREIYYKRNLSAFFIESEALQLKHIQQIMSGK